MYPLREQKIFGRQAGGAGGGRLKAVMGRNRGRRDKGGGGGAALKVQGVSKSYSSTLEEWWDTNRGIVWPVWQERERISVSEI